MANIVIDGIVEEATLRRSARGQSVFETVTIRSDSGKPRTFRKLIVANAMRELLKPGLSGRFYFHNFIDQKGLHGLRADGHSLFAFPGNAEKLLGILGLLNLLLLAGWIAMDGGVRLLPAIFGPLCTALWVALRSARKGAEAQFAADAGVAQVQPRSAPATSL